MYLNQGIDLINVEAAMKTLDLTPDDLEIPIPRCYLEDRAEVCHPTCSFLRSVAHSITWDVVEILLAAVQQLEERAADLAALLAQKSLSTEQAMSSEDPPSMALDAISEVLC